MWLGRVGAKHLKGRKALMVKPLKTGAEQTERLWRANHSVHIGVVIER
jgi:hypothetical protein